MKRNLFAVTNRRPLLYSLFALLIVFFVNGCQGCRNNENNFNDIKHANSLNIVLNEENSQLTDDEIRSKFSGLLDSHRNKLSNNIRIRRCPCDSTLISIALPEGTYFEGQDGNVTIKPIAEGSTGGEDITKLGTIAVNVQLSTFDRGAFSGARLVTTSSFNDDSIASTTIVNALSVPLQQAFSTTKSTTKAPVRIAFLDSGFDPSVLPKNVDWKTSTTIGDGNSPQSTSDQGWDFTTNQVNGIAFDDQKVKHGSRVALLAALEFAKSDVPIKIIPMKVLNKENKGDLFGILCALATAHKNNVDIINMSLGYYGTQNTVFKNYIERCTKDSIWIVAAAGNERDVDCKRNLSTMASDSMFYPAMFSNENKRVIAVTTVNPDNGKVSVLQNFDPKFVVGIKGDIAKNSVAGTLSYFALIKNTEIFGTSYATPIMTGWLGQRIRDKNVDFSSLDNVLEPIHPKADKGEIYNGNVITRNYKAQN